MKIVYYIIERYDHVLFQSNFNKSVMNRGNYIEQIVERRDKISYLVTDMHTGDESIFSQINKGSSLTDLLGVLKLLSQHGIKIHGSCILSRSSSKTIPQIRESLVAHNMNMDLNIAGPFPHMLNEFSNIDNTYQSLDTMITDLLEKMALLEKHFGIAVTTPKPFDYPDQHCNVFWENIQVWPVADTPKERYHENLLPHACKAVVRGNRLLLF